MIKPRKAVMEMEEYNPPTSGRGKFLRMDFNENLAGCSPKAIRALKSIKQNDLSAYPEYSKLCKNLAGYFKIIPEEVIPTNGTDEAIKAVIETYIEKGKDEIIIPVPTYAMFKFYAQLNEAIIKEMPYNDGLSFPAKKVLNAISKKTKIVVLVNPNNPTGTSISREDINKILEKAKENNSIVLIDEAYCRFSSNSSVPLIKSYENLIVTQTFSKAFGLAGLRLGCIISNKNNIKIIKKVLSPYSVNIAASVCASAALKDINYIRWYAKEIEESKSILYSAMDCLGIKYFRSDANFVLLKIGKKLKYFCEELKKSGILARDRGADALLEGCVRVTLGTKKQTKILAKSISKIIKNINPLLIFDIDGVLADVSNSYRIAIKQTAEYFTGEEISPDEIQNYKNRGGYNNDWDLAESVIKSRGKITEKNKIIKKFQAYYKKSAGNEKWLLNKKILMNLSKIYNLAIFTGRPGKEADYVLRKNNVKKFFQSVVAMEDISMQKPNPEGIVKILSQFAKPDAFYFGDTVDDMKSAVSANAIPIGILPPQDKSSGLKNILMRAGAKCVLDDINKISEALK